ncbi:MAG: hypothetical protein NT075_37430 [Chloroflexi bacterium]|nr:hypothetical protein [Chloroflexota bacterium]
MAKFILSTLYTALLLPIYLHWSRQQTEHQIDKMQEAVFNTPGAEAIVTAPVLLGGVMLLIFHFLVARRALNLKTWQGILSLFVSIGVGLGIFMLPTQNVQ